MTDYSNLLEELKVYRRIRVSLMDEEASEESIAAAANLQGAIMAVEAVIAEQEVAAAA